MDIFISYKTENRAAAESVARAFTARHYTVWWDNDLRDGDQWLDKINEELQSARCVVVLWCEHAKKSDYVKAEALKARKWGTYAGVCPSASFIETLPAPFNIYQASLLDPALDAADCDQLVSAIARKIGPPAEGASPNPQDTLAAYRELLARAFQALNNRAVEALCAALHEVDLSSLAHRLRSGDIQLLLNELLPMADFDDFVLSLATAILELEEDKSLDAVGRLRDLAGVIAPLLWGQ